MQYNWKGIRDKHKEKKAVFNRPGFEQAPTMLLESHDMNELVDVASLTERIDAIPRIQKPEVLQHTKRLIDLEHYSIRSLLATKTRGCLTLNTLQGYLTSSWFLTAYPQKLMPFREGDPQNFKVYLIYFEDACDYLFCEKNDKGVLVQREKLLNIQRVTFSAKMLGRLWLERNFQKEIEILAEQADISLRQTSVRYGELSFLFNDKKNYEYSDQFGLVDI